MTHHRQAGRNPLRRPPMSPDRQCGGALPAVGRSALFLRAEIPGGV